MAEHILKVIPPYFDAAVRAAVERVRAVLDQWPVGDSVHDYSRAVTQCHAVITAALDGAS